MTGPHLDADGQADLERALGLAPPDPADNSVDGTIAKLEWAARSAPTLAESCRLTLPLMSLYELADTGPAQEPRRHRGTKALPFRRRTTARSAWPIPR